MPWEIHIHTKTFRECVYFLRDWKSLEKHTGTLEAFMKLKKWEIDTILAKLPEGEEKDVSAWMSLITDHRESLWIPKWIDLRAFCALMESYIVRGGEVDFEELMKLIPARELHKHVEIPDISWPRLDVIVTHQAADLAQGVIELISNSVDATDASITIGRFGKGFFQSLRMLTDDPDARISIASKNWHNPYWIDLRNYNWTFQIATKKLNITI